MLKMYKTILFLLMYSVVVVGGAFSFMKGPVILAGNIMQK